MSEPINPFTSQPITGSIVSNITNREKLGIGRTAVAVELPNYNNAGEASVYFIEYDFLCHNLQNPDYQKIQHLIQGLWLNGYPLVEGNEVISLSLLQQKLASISLPRTPKEKMDNMLLYIVKQQSEDGAGIQMNTPIAYKRMYFNSQNEAQFYLEAIKADGLVNVGMSSQGYYSVSLTYKGLSYAASLESEGPNSNFCFIAISFADEMAERRDAIIRAIKYHGYEPIIVNNDFIVKNTTPVIDEILAGIKRSRFCVSDFTMQRSGVYFEAGYALGLGRPVIYLSEREDFNANSHFDLRPFQHILYSGLNELETALSSKIAAWIGSRRPEYNARGSAA